jgi:hypothetical protein
MVERNRENGSMQKAPLAFVLTLINSVAEPTMDFMTQDSANAKKHCKVGFDAVWRMLE